MMKAIVATTAKQLEQLANTILSTGDDQLYYASYGWNMPALNRADLAAMVRDAARRVKAVPDQAVTKAVNEKLKELQSRIAFIASNSLPNLAGGNATFVVAQIEQLSAWIDRSLPAPPAQKPVIDWKALDAQGALPPKLAKRLRGLEATLHGLEPRAAALHEKMNAIEAAHDAANSLPTNLAMLDDAAAAVDKAKSDAATAATDASTSAAEIGKVMDKVKQHETEAEKLLEQCGAAYRATTTKGLAAAFEKRALMLNVSIAAWIAGLLGALYLGATLAHERLTLMQQLLASNTSTDRLWVHAVLAILSVGAPVWFAWIATKQIGQRFRLAEDYAFKASVAKAYEGYRREAARIDPELEAKLFASALTRLDEAPLRLVESDTHGSPVAELLKTALTRKSTA